MIIETSVHGKDKQKANKSSVLNGPSGVSKSALGTIRAMADFYRKQEDTAKANQLMIQAQNIFHEAGLEIESRDYA